MVQRGFCGVNSLSTSQALSRVVEVAQGVFLRIIFAFGLGFEKRPLISCDSRWLDFALVVIRQISITHQNRFIYYLVMGCFSLTNCRI